MTHSPEWIYIGNWGHSVFLLILSFSMVAFSQNPLSVSEQVQPDDNLVNSGDCIMKKSALFPVSFFKNLSKLSNVAELKELTRLLPEMVRFEASSEDLELLKDGGVAIIDQWICAHAR